MKFFAQILPPCFWPWFFKTLNPKAEGFLESLTLALKNLRFKGGWVGFEFARVGGKTKGFINTKSSSEVWVDRWVKGEGQGG